MRRLRIEGLVALLAALALFAGWLMGGALQGSGLESHPPTTLMADSEVPG